MAKIFFVGLDGAEKSYRLQTHRPFTVGRDPGNDIILRDPKVSRHHAEVVFERGFFVLHDLASANGTYVNGKRVRVAPLTHGARVRMGNTYGRFSEELPTESDAAPLSAAEPYDQPVPPTADMIEMLPTSPHERVNLQTLPHEKLDPDDLKKKVE
jgi:pSer/pThr/pTyr-binding forkhead associated (FHA) protein